MNTAIYTTKEIADRVRPVAEKYGADRVYLFGSYARNEATEDSDIDFYVEFSKPIGLKYCSFFSDIEDSVDKKVDIVTKDALYNPVTVTINEGFIKRVLEERKCIYEH
ncbi:MAG: nucleotidyltransferase domain-containing protein [Oscillospiraceae bacterium]|nr:nucleotidyltransferase domain-containing protein [Oscillospiraceae bacterium]